MRRKHRLITLLCLAVAMLTASAQAGADANTQAQLDALQGKVIATIAPSVPYGPEFIEKLTGVLPGELLFLPTGNETIAAVTGGRADAAFSPREKARLDTMQNDTLASIPASEIASEMVMLLRLSDEALLAQLNAAIDSLLQSGRAQALYTQLVAEVEPSQLNTSVQVPERPGANTLYVGISGDMVPLDYIAADGLPAGFSVALMTEISEIMDVNVVFVPTATDAKFQALASNRIDIFFWHGSNFLNPEGVAVSNVYATTMTGFDFLVQKEEAK